MFKVSILVLAFACSVLAVTQQDVRFLVYTARQNTVPLEVRIGEFAQVDFDTTKDIKIVCHGWKDNGNAAWVEPTKAAFMSRGLTNVISVDWGKHAGGLYTATVGKVKPVAQMVANLIRDLSVSRGIPLSRFHLIGHSLGSHIFGFAAKRLFEATGQRIGRITGLDPAGPSYNGNAESERLSKNDATFVDVLHTSIAIAGYSTSLGDVDYWPNGGSAQPGCSALSDCSHVRACDYYAESITSTSFTAWQCASKKDFDDGKCSGNARIQMGEHVSQSARGDYYLATNSKKPFACNC